MNSPFESNEFDDHLEREAIFLRKLFDTYQFIYFSRIPNAIVVRLENFCLHFNLSSARTNERLHQTRVITFPNTVFHVCVTQKFGQVDTDDFQSSNVNGREKLKLIIRNWKLRGAMHSSLNAPSGKAGVEPREAQFRAKWKLRWPIENCADCPDIRQIKRFHVATSIEETT